MRLRHVLLGALLLLLPVSARADEFTNHGTWSGVGLITT